jgi:hypothetical protein
MKNILLFGYNWSSYIFLYIFHKQINYSSWISFSLTHVTMVSFKRGWVTFLIQYFELSQGKKKRLDCVFTTA